MTRRRLVENPAGVDLLLRVVADQAGRTSCAHCGARLAGASVAIREQDPEQIVIEIACAACGHPVLLRVEPEADGGVARTG